MQVQEYHSTKFTHKNPSPHKQTKKNCCKGENAWRRWKKNQRRKINMLKDKFTIEFLMRDRDKNRKSTCEEIKNKQNKIDIAYTSIQIIERCLIFSLNVVCSRNIQATVFFLSGRIQFKLLLQPHIEVCVVLRVKPACVWSIFLTIGARSRLHWCTLLSLFNTF